MSASHLSARVTVLKEAGIGERGDKAPETASAEAKQIDTQKLYNHMIAACPVAFRLVWPADKKVESENARASGRQSSTMDFVLEWKICDAWNLKK